MNSVTTVTINIITIAMTCNFTIIIMTLSRGENGKRDTAPGRKAPSIVTLTIDVAFRWVSLRRSFCGSAFLIFVYCYWNIFPTDDTIMYLFINIHLSRNKSNLQMTNEEPLIIKMEKI